MKLNFVIVIMIVIFGSFLMGVLREKLGFKITSELFGEFSGFIITLGYMIWGSFLGVTLWRSGGDEFVG